MYKASVHGNTPVPWELPCAILLSYFDSCSGTTWKCLQVYPSLARAGAVEVFTKSWKTEMKSWQRPSDIQLSCKDKEKMLSHFNRDKKTLSFLIKLFFVTNIVNHSSKCDKLSIPITFFFKILYFFHWMPIRYCHFFHFFFFFPTYLKGLFLSFMRHDQNYGVVLKNATFSLMCCN